MEQCVLFDFDGTIADTSEGINNAFDQAAAELGLDLLGTNSRLGLIGPPIKDSFERLYGLSGEEAKRGAELFRRYYATPERLSEASLYSGIEDVICYLYSHGYSLAVATNKRTDCAESLLKRFGLHEYFHSVRGSESGSYVTKDQIVKLALSDLGWSGGQRGLMIGDTVKDFEAGATSGLDFIAVTYGFGYAKGDIVSDAYLVCDKTIDLVGAISGYFSATPNGFGY